MSGTIRKEIVLRQPREEVWKALTNSETLAEWMFPNDFQARVGHHFTFRVPPDPATGFRGLVVRCEVLECDAPTSLAFSWSAWGPVENTRVSYRLETEGEGTRLLFEHAGFDLAQPRGDQAYQGAQFGWNRMHEKMRELIANPAADRTDGTID